MNPAEPLSHRRIYLPIRERLLLHWPDVMFTYIKELKVLVSCDAFGAHYASDASCSAKKKTRTAITKLLFITLSTSWLRLLPM
jgi:hypothetical protein